MVVQSWRAKGWDKKQPDSILTLQFADTEGGCEVTMVHALVPEAAAADIKKGWTAQYWKPVQGLPQGLERRTGCFRRENAYLRRIRALLLGRGSQPAPSSRLRLLASTHSHSVRNLFGALVPKCQ